MGQTPEQELEDLLEQEFFLQVEREELDARWKIIDQRKRELINASYEDFDTSDLGENPEKLARLVGDAFIYDVPDKVIEAWVKDFGDFIFDNGYRQVNRRNEDYRLHVMPTITFTRDSVPVELPGQIIAAAKAIQLNGVAVFSIMEHTLSSHGSYYLFVTGENFDQARIIGSLGEVDFTEEDECEPLETVLRKVVRDLWYQSK